VNKRPNFLWISFEDTNPFYGCYGDSYARTPNVDRLASQGCRWPRAFSTAGVCAPARSAVITSMYPTSMGTHHMRTTHTSPYAMEVPTPYHAVPPHYVKCFTEYLRAAGYYCTNNHKTDYQFEAPLTAWDDCSRTAHWRNRPSPDQPFFAVFNPTMTHESGMWSERSIGEFDPDKVAVPPYFPDTPKVRRAIAAMYHNISQADAVMGELLSALEADGLSENTIVFHWSDHGPMPRGKRFPYDSGIRVPMIVRWAAGLKAGSVCQDLVSTIDLGPTVLSLAGLEIPTHMQGRAFLGPKAQSPRKYIYASRDRHDISYDMVRAVRDERFKYMRNFCPDQPYMGWVPYLYRHPIAQELWRCHIEGTLKGEQNLLFSPRPVEELYDTQADPWETRNLAGDAAYRSDLERLRAALEDWRREVGDMGEIPETQMVRQWYPDGEQPRTAQPLFVPIERGGGHFHPSGGGVFQSPMAVQVYCATQGASVAYRLQRPEAPTEGQAQVEPIDKGWGGGEHWLLYTGPLRLEPGKWLLRAKAVRIGYADSAESRAYFEVTG
jgi:arylsulfatase A-like enzyme